MILKEPEREKRSNEDQKLPENELATRLAKAAEQIKVGATYRHYKDQLYTVLNLAILEATNETCVIYQAQYGQKLTFIRPVAEWLQEVTWQGKTLPRFTKT